MFTGIVAAVGRIEQVEPLGASADAGVRLQVHAGGLDLTTIKPGDSIALQGACMTATRLEGERFAVDVSRESLLRTVGLDRPGPVNLESALHMGDALGGHLVSGHVDGLAHVTHFAPLGESHRLEISVPANFGQFLAYKGSVAINGVSLTVNEVTDDDAGTVIAINLIPHTVASTTLQYLQVGDAVNFEVDLIARYVQRMLAAR